MNPEPASASPSWLKRALRRGFRRLVDRLPMEPWLLQRIYHWSLLGMYSDQINDPRVTIGRHTYGMRRGALNIWLPEDRVSIGNYCSVAEGVRFVFGEHSTATVSTFPLRTVLGGAGNADAFNKGPIEVGSDVWIGTNSTILSGIRIGHGAVVAAGAVVTKDVPPFAVVGGVPAKLIKMRFPPAQVQRLLEIAWWDWPEDRVRACLEDFYHGVDDFIDRHSSGNNDRRN